MEWVALAVVTGGFVLWLVLDSRRSGIQERNAVRAKPSYPPPPPSPPRPVQHREPVANQHAGKVSYPAETMKLTEVKPYLALIGRQFDVWGIVEVVGRNKTHVAAKNIPKSVLTKIGLASVSEPAAIEKKLLLASTKGFEDVPLQFISEAIEDLRDNLISISEDVEERDKAAMTEYADDPKIAREEIRDNHTTDLLDFWREEISEFKATRLPQCRADYAEHLDDEAEQMKAEAERARKRQPKNEQA